MQKQFYQTNKHCINYLSRYSSASGEKFMVPKRETLGLSYHYYNILVLFPIDLNVLTLAEY